MAFDSFFKKSENSEVTTKCSQLKKLILKLYQDNND